MNHEPRINYFAFAPKSAQALTAFSHASGKIDARLRELVNLRISQINGCAFCIDMHWAALVKMDVDPRHVNAVAGWREAHRFFSDRDRAALGWAESVNAIPQRTPSDAEFDAMRANFSDEEIVELTYAVTAIRAWNAMNASFHMPVPEKPFGS